MSNLSFEISHFTGRTTRILSALQGLFPSSNWFDLKFGQKISKSYITNMPRNFLWNNYFLSNFCFVICHLTGKCLRSFASFFPLLVFSPTRRVGFFGVYWQLFPSLKYINNAFHDIKSSPFAPLHLRQVFQLDYFTIWMYINIYMLNIYVYMCCVVMRPVTLALFVRLSGSGQFPVPSHLYTHTLTHMYLHIYI